MTTPAKTYKEYRLFGQAVRQARIDRGLTIAQLGELVGLHESSMRCIELGKQGIYLRNAIQLSNLLGINLNALFT